MKQFAFVSFKNKPISDDDVAKLIPLLRHCPNLLEVDFSGTSITDASVAKLETLPENVQAVIRLENTAVSKAGRFHVGGLRTSEYVEFLTTSIGESE